MNQINIKEVLKSLKFFKRDSKLILQLGKELETEIGSFLQFSSSASGINVIGNLSNTTELPEAGEVGDSYVIHNYLWTWTGSEFEKLGQLGGTILVEGEVATYADLPTGLTIEDTGKAYYVGADRLLYVWGGQSFPADGDGIDYQGPTGQTGFAPELGIVEDGERRVLQIAG